MLSEVKVAVFTFALMISYLPGTLGAATTLRWGLLWGLLPCLVLQSLQKISAYVTLFAIFMIAVNVIVYDYQPDIVLAFLLILSTLLSFWVGLNLKSLRIIFIGAACGIGLNSAIAIFQWFWPYDWFNAGGLTQRLFPVMQVCCKPSGLFINKKNENNQGNIINIPKKAIKIKNNKNIH
jgi:hypothetical protein